MRRFPSAIVEHNIDALFADCHARGFIAGLAMQMSDDDLLNRALEDRFSGDAPFRLERALDRDQWDEALKIIDLYTEDLEGQMRIPPDDMARILQVLLMPETERVEAFGELIGEIAPNAHSYLVISRFAHRYDAAEIGAKSFEYALSQDVWGDRDIRLRLAFECMDRDQPERAITLLESNVDVNAETRERGLLAMAYTSTSIIVASVVDFFRFVQRAGNATEGGTACGRSLSFEPPVPAKSNSVVPSGTEYRTKQDANAACIVAKSVSCWEGTPS